MDTIPDELLPAFCTFPATVVALSVACRRFYQYFRDAPPIFTCVRAGGAATHTISSTWYTHYLDLERCAAAGGMLNGDKCTDHNPFRYIYEKSPMYVLGETEFEGNVYFSTDMPWFYPLAPSDWFAHAPQLRWFRRAQKFMQTGKRCCAGVTKIGEPVDAFVTHGGSGQFLIPVNERIFNEMPPSPHIGALYRIVPKKA